MDVYIYRIRLKLKKISHPGVRTVFGRGYILDSAGQRPDSVTRSVPQTDTNEDRRLDDRRIALIDAPRCLPSKYPHQTTNALRNKISIVGRRLRQNPMRQLQWA